MNEERERYLTPAEIYAQTPPHCHIHWNDINRITQEELDKTLAVIEEISGKYLSRNRFRKETENGRHG